MARAHRDIASGAVHVEHVQYVDTITDPVGTVRRLYARFGWEYTDAYDTALKAYLDENNRQREAKSKAAKMSKEKAKKGGKADTQGSADTKKEKGAGLAAHTYSLGEYGLEEEAMKGRLQWYYDTYLRSADRKK